MRKIIFFLGTLCLVVLSCTKDKTDYQAELDTTAPAHPEFKEVLALESGGYTVHLEALNGILYKGYNDIRFQITNNQTNEIAKVDAVTFLPVLTGLDGSKKACPHQYDLAYNTEAAFFSGYAVFTSESDTNGSWELYLSFHVDQKHYTAHKDVIVQKQNNQNLSMTSFRGNDSEEYVIALVSPQRPKVAENELVAGIYKVNQSPDTLSENFPDPVPFSYTKVSGYILQLDPRMPEPSMGNHSSPNNKDLTMQGDGLYHGRVNYTMTGNWTLNFILLNEKGRIVRGTNVSKDFTPGIEGEKSELFIDILF